MANTTLPVLAPAIKILTGTDATILAAAVATQVNTLNQLLVHTPLSPGSAGTTTSGTVQSGSIVVDPVQVASINNVLNMAVSVRWVAQVVPS